MRSAFGQVWQAELYAIVAYIALPMAAGAIACWMVLWLRSRNATVPAVNLAVTAVCFGIGFYPLVILGWWAWPGLISMAWMFVLMSVLLVLILTIPSVTVAIAFLLARAELRRHGRGLPSWVAPAIFTAAVVMQYGWFRLGFLNFSS